MMVQVSQSEPQCYPKPLPTAEAGKLKAAAETVGGKNATRESEVCEHVTLQDLRVLKHHDWPVSSFLDLQYYEILL